MINKEKLAFVLKSEFKDSVVKSDDWLPLAEYIINLLNSKNQHGKENNKSENICCYCGFVSNSETCKMQHDW